MSDKFLGSGGGNINLSNGSATIFSATLGANSLDPSRPVKTNSVKQLVSANLDISEINTLATQLTEKDELTFVEDDTHTTPATGKVKIYAKTDKSLYTLDDTGTETAIGGSGGSTTLQDAYVNSGNNPLDATIDIDNTRYAIQIRNTTGAEANTQLQVVNSIGQNRWAVQGNGSTTQNRNSNADDLKQTYTTATTPFFETGLLGGSDNYHIKSLFSGNSVLEANFTNDKLTIANTNFTDNQEIVSKLYVDNQLSGNSAKTQNISATLTDATKTVFDKGDVLFGINPMEVNDEFSIKQELNFNNITSPETGGFRFTIRSGILIKYVCFKVSHWGSTDTTKVWNLYNSDSKNLVSTLTLNKNLVYNDYYYNKPTSPIYIPAGSYACALILNNGDKKHNFSSAGDFFNDLFIGPNGAFSSPDPAPTLAYPNGGSNTPASAIVFDVIDKVINNGTTELQQETIINSAKIGYEFSNYFLDGLGDGAGNLYGNPSITPDAVYTNVLNLGGNTLGNAGKLIYEILNVVEAGTILNWDTTLRMTPWSADGGIMVWDWGVWRLQYNNRPVAGTSQWEITENGNTIYINIINLITDGGSYNEITINCSFNVDTQTLSVSQFNQNLFTFTDSTPRTLTQAQRNLFSISGGGEPSATNETRIYNLQIYNPASTTPIVNIDNNLSSVEFTKHLTTTQTVFTNDQELITKKYFDDNTGGGGDVAGPATSTDNAIARFNGATGKIIQNSNATVDDTGLINSVNIQTRQILGNCALGYNSLPAMVNGADNCIIGSNAGINLNGQENTMLGCFAGNALTTGFQNVLIGYSAGYGVVGNYNICIGNGSNSTGNSSTVIGRQINNSASNVVVLGEATKTAIYNAGNGVCDLGTATNKFKDIHLGGEIIGMPYDVIFAATDEVNAITTTGQKMELRCPRSFQTTKIKISVNVANTNTGFQIQIKKNGTVVQTIGQSLFLVSNTTDTTTYNEDDIISVEVPNVGNGNSTGLKVYLIGKTV